MVKFEENEKWRKRIEKIDFALQPIVNIHTGICYGYEALLRNYEAAGFKSIDDFFDTAFEECVLHHVDICLRKKAIHKFSKIACRHSSKLFFNIDNRLLDSNDYKQGDTSLILKEFSLPHDAICFEISEKQKLKNSEDLCSILKAYREQNFKIAIDDYGTGISGLQMIYYAEPDFIKIDRFFVSNINNDSRKRLFVSTIVDLAHMLGMNSIAEGVETEAEYYTCRDLGCDLIQGYFIQKPEQSIDNLKTKYDHIELLSRLDKRVKSARDRFLINSEIEYIECLSYDTDLIDVIEKFRRKKNNTFLPVVNYNNEPIGIIREKSLKDYTYSRFGKELLLNPSYGKNLGRFMNRFPSVDIHTPIEKILEIYSQNENIEGIIIVDSMKYVGFLSAASLLKIINEKNIAKAREENPLTRLPGNTMIYEYVSNALQDLKTKYVLLYFDFDYFKPYNDKYGFRNGDRVILLFSEMLKKFAFRENRFAGHIGGDDFFMGVSGECIEDIYGDIVEISETFSRDVESFYDKESLKKGYIKSKDRNGVETKFPVITVSSVALELSDTRKSLCSTGEIGTLLADLKKKAKIAKNKICILKYPETNTNTDESINLSQAF